MKWLIALMLIPLAAGADSYAPTLPALYAVIDVSPDDTLNLRLEPRNDATVQHQLAHDAKDLQVILLSREGNWAYINEGDQTGWAATRFLERQLGDKDQYGLPPTLSCFGTEPFWTVTFTPEGLQIDTPDGTKTYPISSTSPSRVHVMLNIMGFRFAWNDGDQTINAHILPGLCNDGMSDGAYGLHYVDASLSHGCCSL